MAEEDLSSKMSELYVAECNAAKARLEVETECRRIIADNYEKVMTQVQEHSKKLEVPTTAKICEVGYFCDAHIVRTNQVSMEMGSQYFVECSIHTAEKIVKRRVEEMRTTRDEGLESIRILNDKIKFAQENFASVAIEGGPIEIVEKYDDEMERMFYDNRKKRNLEKQQKNDESAENGDSKDNNAHDKVMDRLEELEKLEADNNEIGANESEVSVPKSFEVSVDELEKLEEMEEEDESSNEAALRFGMNERLLAQPGVSQKEMERLLEFLDDCDRSSDEEYDDEEEEENEEEETEGNENNRSTSQKVVELDSDDYDSDDDKAHNASKVQANVQEITEKLASTKIKRKKSGVRFAEKLENVKTFLQSDTVEIKEEAVIETKSILRNTEPTPVDPKALAPELKEFATMSTATFPGEIVEKDPYDCEPSTSKDPAPVITEKKISKFRASRNRN
ncbi:hypothetical protein B9Z55_001123 [Caenorhabditis nigoni]|uniref:Uncharacterized protein n=1 Tax=Caenorhabditis nigoni TaxID=1611254 RepID=A0A2G5VE74_9PELO|nr:hypothetical protein B9Z55_001123 [Caenorhabditis nigoni]